MQLRSLSVVLGDSHMRPFGQEGSLKNIPIGHGGLIDKVPISYVPPRVLSCL